MDCARHGHGEAVAIFRQIDLLNASLLRASEALRLDVRMRSVRAFDVLRTAMSGMASEWRARQGSNLQPPAPEAGTSIQLSYGRFRYARFRSLRSKSKVKGQRSKARLATPPPGPLTFAFCPLTFALATREASVGAPGRTRTCDLRIRSPALYPTELRAHKRSSYHLTRSVLLPEGDTIDDCAPTCGQLRARARRAGVRAGDQQPAAPQPRRIPTSRLPSKSR